MVILDGNYFWCIWRLSWNLLVFKKVGFIFLREIGFINFLVMEIVKENVYFRF